MTNITLDITVIETNSPYHLGVGDLTRYPSGFNIISPTIQITPPNFNSVVLDFTASSINLFDSLTLGITCEGQPTVELPDGIYTLKYTFTPAYAYFVTKTFMRVDRMQESLDSLFISLDIAQCDKLPSDIDKRKLDDINMYMQFAIASANKCANIYAIESYTKAAKLINQYNKSHGILTC